MAKQSINVGATANDKKGDSLRAAFQKVNANFTELYTQLGLAADDTLNLGAFEFTGSVMTTTDSSGITIDQAVTVTSDLTVSGNIFPSGGLLGQVYGDSNELTLKSPTGGGGVGYVALASPNEQTYVEVNNDKIVLGVEFGTAGFEKIEFKNNGDLTIPGSIVSNNAVIVTSEIGATSSGVFLDGANNVILFATNNAIIRSDNDGTFKDLTFSADGNLQAPGTVSAPNINATNHFMLPVYATGAARDSAITSPQPGMMVFVTGGEGAGLQVRGATQWNPVGGLTGV